MTTLTEQLAAKLAKFMGADDPEPPADVPSAAPAVSPDVRQATRRISPLSQDPAERANYRGPMVRPLGSFGRWISSWGR
jgi:hypothetical protein